MHRKAVEMIGRQRLRRPPTMAFERKLSTSFPTTIQTMPFARNRLVTRATSSSQILLRSLSTEMRAQTAAAAAANASVAAEAAAGGGSSKKKPAESNLFLDNLGKIFLLGIGTVIVTLVRSSYNTSNRHLIRDRLEEIAAIDPKEIEEFREANSELTLDAMRQILSIYYQEEATSRDDSGVISSYDDFVIAIRKIMATRFPNHGEAFTIQTGHYLDRIVVAALGERGEGAPHVAEHKNTEDKVPVALFFAAMASAMNGSVSDRIRILHEILGMEEESLKQYQQQGGMGMTMEGGSNAKTTANSVPLTRIRDMVGYLQETCQLPPDTQIVPTERKYPTQEWRRATPMDMVPDISEDGKEAGGEVDLVEFAAILRTKSVCAWGECYMKWKPDASEFETQEALPSAGVPTGN